MPFVHRKMHEPKHKRFARNSTRQRKIHERMKKIVPRNSSGGGRKSRKRSG